MHAIFPYACIRSSHVHSFGAVGPRNVRGAASRGGHTYGRVHALVDAWMVHCVVRLLGCDAGRRSIVRARLNWRYHHLVGKGEGEVEAEVEGEMR